MGDPITPIQHVFDIPELTSHIFSFLTQRDLLKFIHLNKRLHSICIPHFYADISITKPLQFHRFKSPAAQVALLSYGIHIRSFKTRYFNILRSLLQGTVDCRNLSRLEFLPGFDSSDPAAPPGFYAKSKSKSTSPNLWPSVDHIVSLKQEGISRVFEQTSKSISGTLLISIMDKCPRLSVFIMTGYPFNHHQLIRRIGDRLTLPLPTRQYTTLKRLELTDMEFQPATAVMVKYLLDCCSPVLEELLISVSSGIAVGIESDDEDEDYTESDENEGLAVKQYSKETGNADASVQAQAPYITVEGREWKLWRLVLRGDLGRQGSLVWLPLMQRCFQLQEFFISVYCNQMIKRLAYTLRHYCPKISDITLRCMTEIPQDDSMISDLIQSSQSLKRLSISFFSGFGPLSTAALVGHSTTLETLVLEDCYGIISEDIQAVLSSCANLKTFRVVPTHNTSTAYLEADDLVDSPWACLRLEHLQLIIEGIPRPDIRNNRYGERLTGPLHDGTITGFDLQKKVYQQLGKLTKLRELWLGFNNENLDDIGFDRFTIDDLHLGFFDSGEQVECLEFSLESGLELLHGLKELRVLKIDSLRTRIGLSEAMWMGREWPKLKRIYGMVFRGNAALPESVIWLTKNRKDIHLVPLPGNFSVLQ